jgi:hypothetical protein
MRNRFILPDPNMHSISSISYADSDQDHELFNEKPSNI